MTTVGDPRTVIICGDHFDGHADALGEPIDDITPTTRVDFVIIGG